MSKVFGKLGKKMVIFKGFTLKIGENTAFFGHLKKLKLKKREKTQAYWLQNSTNWYRLVY